MLNIDLVSIICRPQNHDTYALLRTLRAITCLATVCIYVTIYVVHNLHTIPCGIIEYKYLVISSEIILFTSI